MVAYGTTYVNNILPFIPLVGTLVHSITLHKHHMNTSNTTSPAQSSPLPWPVDGLACLRNPTNQPTNQNNQPTNQPTNRPNPPTNPSHQPIQPTNQPTNAFPLVSSRSLQQRPPLSTRSAGVGRTGWPSSARPGMLASRGSHPAGWQSRASPRWPTTLVRQRQHHLGPMSMVYMFPPPSAVCWHHASRAQVDAGRCRCDC